MPSTDEKEVLAGLVERVTFHNEENGFCVLRVKVRGQKDIVTVLGYAAAISAGEWVTASGVWQNDRTHGLQFRAQFLKATEPTSIEGMEKYLASGMIRGVGPVYAKRLIHAFGDKVFDVIQTAPGRLREVGGIGPRAAAARSMTLTWPSMSLLYATLLRHRPRRNRQGGRKWKSRSMQVRMKF
jgi:exodeoxyribonuclease V alpha subunit